MIVTDIVKLYLFFVLSFTTFIVLSPLSEWDFHCCSHFILSFSGVFQMTILIFAPIQSCNAIAHLSTNRCHYCLLKFHKKVYQLLPEPFNFRVQIGMITLIQLFYDLISILFLFIFRLLLLSSICTKRKYGIH